MGDTDVSPSKDGSEVEPRGRAAPAPAAIAAVAMCLTALAVAGFVVDRHDVMNKNFASKLPLVDLAFRSLHIPRREWPRAYGMDEQAPESYVRQLAWPFAPAGKS